MRRIQIEPRQNWQQKVEQCGLVFHTEDQAVYWNESAYYEFTSSEIDDLETASNELHKMCMDAVEHVIANKRYDAFGLNPQTIQAIEWAWEAEPPNLYGRFDFVYDGTSAPKLLEYNADTPTSLLEAAVVQWKWLQEVFPNSDQFNSIWEGLIEQWKWLKDNRKLLGSQIHFAHGDLWEDELTVAVLRDTAQEAGLATQGIQMKDIIVYFIKLILVNPTVGFFAGCAAGATNNHSNNAAPSNAVTATFIVGFFANLIITYAAYLVR